MHPTYSVIFFTTASGAGYGLLLLLSLFAALGQVAPAPGFGLVGMGAGLALVTAGLLSSTYHLGHPERAWRALSQWRTSSLSREGLMAMLTFVPTGLVTLAWAFGAIEHPFWRFIALIAVVFCLLTVICTAMIYTSLKTIKAWCNGWVPVGYVLHALMSGAILMSLLQCLFDHADASLRWTAIAATALALAAKLGYWRSIDATPSASTPETATGLKGTVRLLESPHTQPNYLLREMGYQIARKHAAKLRLIATGLAYIAPLVLLPLGRGSGFQSVTDGLAVVAAGIGLMVERWLFFAEARHVVTLYYGAETA